MVSFWVTGGSKHFCYNSRNTEWYKTRTEARLRDTKRIVFIIYSEFCLLVDQLEPWGERSWSGGFGGKTEL